MAGAIKLSRIPYGFFEKEMWKYFSQFGRVQRLKLFRSTKTGNSKGFAFVQFAHESVAKIVTETMNNYLMFDKLLKCKFIPESEILPAMFKNWRQVMIPKLGETVHKRKANSEKDEYHDARSRSRLYSKLIKRNEKMQQLGINYQFQIPIDPKGKPVLRRPPRKSEVKSEGEGLSKSKVANDTLVSQPSTYSLIMDSSDDEIEFRTPPNTVKKRKWSKDEDIEEISVKDEPLSGDDEDDEVAKKRAIEAAQFIKLPISKPEPVEEISKKKAKKLKKADAGKVTKFRKTGRYFSKA
jgi:nucleolar protein 15